MFRHLKVDEFLNAVEAGSLLPERRAHLDGCAACTAQFRSIEAAHAALSGEDSDDIPQPDWNEFRGSVRTALLSRSIQRESALRRWTGWPIRPAAAWAISFLLLICLSAGGFYWHLSKDPAAVTLHQDVAAEPAVGAVGDDDTEVWTNTSFFEELPTLEEAQAERLRLLLESGQKSMRQQ
jgi:hypothetical protein